MSNTPDTSASLNDLIDKLRALEPQLSEDERQLLWKLIEAGADALRGTATDTQPTRLGMFDPSENDEEQTDPYDSRRIKVGNPEPEAED